MMQTMRNLAHTKVVKLLMIVLVVSFALWGIGDIFKGNPLERAVAKVGRQSITVQELTREFDADLPRMRQTFGPEITAQQAKQLGFLDKTLQTMIQRSQIDQEIDKLGISVSRKTVLDDIAAQPYFRDKDGKFNATLFHQLLEQQHMNESLLVEQGQRDLERQQIVGALTPPENVPQNIIDGVYKARGQKRFVDILTLNNSSMTNIAEPDDKALQDYYQQHVQDFTAPEYRAITIARMSVDAVAKDISISDDDIKADYEKEKDQLRIPERRDLLQVVMQDEAKAKKLSDSLKDGGDLKKVAKEMGFDAVALNDTEDNGLPSELAKVVFELKEGQTSQPVQTSLGWHVAQVKKIMPTKMPSLEEVKDQLRSEMQKNQAIESTTKLVNQWDDELAAGHSLEDIADAMKLRLIKIGSLDANGKQPDGKDPAELPAKDAVLKTVFAQASGEVSPILDDKNGNYSVVRTDSITPSAPKPFDQVKKDVLTAWKAQEQAKAAQAEADKIAQGLRDGKDARDFGKQAGVTIRTSDGISMLGDEDPDMPPSLLPKIYKLKMKEVTTASVGDKQYVLQLVKTADADPQVGDKAKFKISNEVSKNATTELTQEYLDYLGQIFPVKTNQELLETLRQQGS